MSKGEVKLEVVADLFDLAKVEHIAKEQGRDFNEVAVELLEREADRELAKLEPPGALVVAGIGLSAIRVEGSGGGSIVVLGDGNRVTV